MCGTAYAINGHMMKVGDCIFLFTPANVSISKPDALNTLGSEPAQSTAFLNRDNQL
jgi:FtsZ-interacting cell division protein YlmF